MKVATSFEQDTRVRAAQLARISNPASGRIVRSLLTTLEPGRDGARSPRSRSPFTPTRWRQTLMAFARYVGGE